MVFVPLLERNVPSFQSCLAHMLLCVPAVLSPLQKLPIKHIPGPEGVRGRNSDNTLILEKLGWQPTVSLRDGLRMTYFWIKGQIEQEVKQRGADAAAAYAHSTVVKTGAPTELGTLRKADGEEGFDKTATATA